MRKTVSSLIILLLIPLSAALAGQVRFVAEESGKALTHTRVLVDGDSYVTDSYGDIYLSLPDGEYDASVRREGGWVDLPVELDGSTTSFQRMRVPRP